MRLPLEVVIVSATPLYASAVRQVLQDDPDPARCEILGETPCPGVPTTCQPGVVLIAPRHWEEMARWLCPLRQLFYASPWLLLTDLRVAGMFCAVLETRRAAVLPNSATAQDLRHRVRLMAEQETSSPTAELLSLFNRNACQLPTGRPPCLLTPRELQCACAISLGLSNRQIAEVLHLGDATVKSHVHRLLDKLELSNREDLGAYVEQALTPGVTPFWCREIQPKVWK
jgi:DNA-binding NarL/FixJ family response regulator